MAFLAVFVIIAVVGAVYFQRSEKTRADRTVTALPHRLSVRYFDDTVLLTDTDAWVYLRLPTTSVEFRTAEEWDRLISSQAHGLAGLTDTEIHLKTVFREYDIADWARQLDERTRNPLPDWDDLLIKQQEHLWDERFLRKEVYLGIRLGLRGDEATSQLVAVVRSFGRWLNVVADAVVGEDEVIDPKEIAKWRGKAAPVQRMLRSSAFRAVPATVSELVWLFQHHMHPGMPTPPAPAEPNRPWGRGEVQHLAEGLIDNSLSPYFLRLVQPNWSYLKELLDHRAHPETYGAPQREYATYVATLCISRMPREMDTWDGNPWIHHAEDPSLGFPVEFSGRYEVHPPAKAKKDVQKQLQKLKGQRQHIAESGAEVPTLVADAFLDGKQLDVEVERSRKFLIYGAGRLLVQAEDPDELTRRCEVLVEHYRNIGIDVAWTANDQLRLFTEQFPGDRSRLKVRAYRQVHELEVVAAGLSTVSNSLGDGEGPFLGITTGRSQEIVYFDPLYAPRNNQPPGVAIVGAPGGGKTFTTLTIAYQTAMRGITTVLLDPKGDAKGLATIGGLGDVRVLELGARMAGLLDPFSLAESRESGVLLAMETMRLLLGGEMTADRENAVVSAIREVSRQPQPNLRKVVTLLSSGGAEQQAGGSSTFSERQIATARSVGSLLEVISELPLANLCFSESRVDIKLAKNRLSILTLAGLSLPTSQTPMDRYTYAQRLSVTLLYLVTHYTRSLVTDPLYTGQKALIIDEAWALTQTQQGAQLIAEVARLGRSRNTALLLVSQNAKDLLAEDIRNCLTTMFVFRSEDPGEVAADIELLRIADSPDHRGVIASLPTGSRSECIMRDARGHVGTMRVDMSYLPEVMAAFDSTPDDGSGRIQSSARRIVTDSAGRVLGVADDEAGAEAIRRSTGDAAAADGAAPETSAAGRGLGEAG